MSSEIRYPNVVRAVLETPWAILPSHLAAIIEIVTLRAAGGDAISDEEFEARVGAGRNRRDAQRNGATAVLPIYGAIVPKADQFTQMSGGTPLNRFQSDLAAAVKDPDVANVLLDIDSPGGATDLVTEAAADIRAAAKVKPVVAIANTKAASAAYWLGSQAGEFVASPSAHVGSIGVFAAHDDVSKALEMQGVNTSLISAGKYKTETSPLGPLSDDAREYVQGLVDAQYATFTADVARGRRVAVDQVRNGFGEGRMLPARQAARLGMIDAVESIDQTLARLASGGGITTPAPDEPPEVPAGITGSEPSLSFTAALRRTLGTVEQHVADARGFASVGRDGRLTDPKRELFRALADALGEFGMARDEVVALLADTDPEKPHREALAAVAMHQARLAKTRGVAR